MAGSEERLKILNMVQEGILTPEEGLRLLEALERHPTQPAPPAASQARWMHVLITDLTSGKTRVNVRLPVAVLNTGLRMGARFSTDINQIDMGQIKDAIRNGSTGKVMDIIDEEDGEHIQIMLE